METDRLKYFCAISEYGSMTKAAEVLNVSHSGLSKAMNILQQETKLQLFRPIGRGIELTQAGKDFYIKAKHILNLLNELSQDKLVSVGKKNRIAMTEIFSISISGELAKALDHNVDFFELSTGQTESQIINEDIDFALTFMPYPNAELDYLKIKKIQMEVYVTNKELLKLSIHQIPFVTPSIAMQDNPLSLKSRDGWPIQIDRTCAYGAGSLASALTIVNAGIAAVFIPQFLADLLNKNRKPESKLIPYGLEAKMVKDSSRDIFIVKKRSLDETKEMKIAAKIIRQFC